MKIGNEVYVHGYIDEIRKDTVIIRNDGGYFGTVPSEIISAQTESEEAPQGSESKRWQKIAETYVQGLRAGLAESEDKE